MTVGGFFKNIMIMIEYSTWDTTNSYYAFLYISLEQHSCNMLGIVCLIYVPLVRMSRIDVPL